MKMDNYYFHVTKFLSLLYGERGQCPEVGCLLVVALNLFLKIAL